MDDIIEAAYATGGSVSNGRQVRDLTSGEGIGAFGSRVTTAIQVIEALQDDNISLLGVYGKPGIGKSTLILAVLNHLEKQKLCDEIVVVKLTEFSNIRSIQDEIAKQLDLKIEAHDTPARIKGRLVARLKQDRRTIIFLDNVRERVELSEIGIPRRSKDCKVLFTTGNSDVCNSMDTQKQIEVNILSPEESMELFRQKAGDMVDTYEFGVVAREIVNQCQGLPLAIVTLGRALHGKKLAIWNYSSRELRNSILKDIEVVHTCIRISYDFIRSKELELCFLLCCLFPAGYLISIDQLLQYLIGEGLLSDEDTLEERRGSMQPIVDELKSLCLLLNTVSGCIMMHDVIRDVAISIASDPRECQRLSSITAGGTCMNWSLPSQTNRTRLQTKSSHGHEHLIDLPSAERPVRNPVSASSGDMTVIQGRVSDEEHVENIVPALSEKVNVTEGRVSDGKHVEDIVSVLSENMNVIGGEVLDGTRGEDSDGTHAEILVSDVSENLDVTGGRVPDRRHVQNRLVLTGDFKSSGGLEDFDPVEETFKCTFAQVKREIWHLFNFRTTVRTLDSKVELLVAKRNVVKEMLDEAEAPWEAVEKWLRTVDDVLTTTANLNGKAAGIKAFVLCSCCTAGRRCLMITDTIQGLLEDANAFGDRVSVGTPSQNLASALSEDVILIDDWASLEKVSAIGSRPRRDSTSSEDIKTFHSRVITEDQVIQALNSDNISLLGVYGLPGVGKTTLISALALHVKEQKIFDEVVVVTLTQTPEIKVIQDDIANALDLIFEDGDIPTTRAVQLFRRLSQARKTLIVLDNLWKRVELAEVGIPQGVQNCKVVFTTREKDLCNVMDTMHVIEVTVLSQEESWQLFRRKAGDMVDSSAFQSVARDIVTNCQGLPLALKILGRALNGKTRAYWSTALTELQNSIFTGSGVLFTCIKFIYDSMLNKDHQLCFLCCCLFPAGYHINMDQLFYYMNGKMQLTNTGTLEERRGRLRSIIVNLTSSCLLSYNANGCILMHDMVRDVAMCIASDPQEDHGFLVGR